MNLWGKREHCSGIPLPEFGGIGVKVPNLMQFMLAQIPSDFSVPTPRLMAYYFCYVYPVMHFAIEIENHI